MSPLLVYFYGMYKDNFTLQEPVICGYNYELYSKMKQLLFMIFIKITYSLVLAFWYWT